MATRERRLAEFNGEGEPPPDLPVQVLCEDQSGTYLLPFACRYIDGEWRNHESGSTVEATVVGWRLHRPDSRHASSSRQPHAVPKCNGESERRQNEPRPNQRPRLVLLCSRLDIGGNAMRRTTSSFTETRRSGRPTTSVNAPLATLRS
jgi:hypothetical protein